MRWILKRGGVCRTRSRVSKIPVIAGNAAANCRRCYSKNSILAGCRHTDGNSRVWKNGNGLKRRVGTTRIGHAYQPYRVIANARKRIGKAGRRSGAGVAPSKIPCISNGG